VEGLQAHGYLLGQNLLIECRFTDGRDERAPGNAAEILSLKPDVIVTVSSPNTLAAKQATGTIPIVMVSVTDPVGRGFVKSLAQPGGNITGLTFTAGVGIVGKQLQLLKEAVPTASRVAVLGYATALGSAAYRGAEEGAAAALQMTLQVYRVRAPEELEGAFAAMTTDRAEALFVESTPFVNLHRERIAALAAQHRLPAIYPNREAAAAGGLLAYAVNEPDLFRRAATYVDKILKGATPADLSVEEPTKVDLLINLKTAQALGLTIPPSLLNRADEVIQ
jgi:putative ABC transport system substrate-binding protein